MQQQVEREEYDTFLIPPATDQQDTEDEDDQPIQIVDANGKKQLVGYAVVWGAVSSVRRDGFKHRFSKGVITWTKPTAALWNHDYGTPLGGTKNNTLTIIEDDYGAKVTIDLDDSSDGTNAFIRVKNKLVDGMSFGGRRVAYDRTSDPKIIDITGFLADEVSLTLIPAMTETAVTTADKSDELQKNMQAQKERAMRFQKSVIEKSKLALLTVGRASTERRVAMGH
jgi:HK97 family phage prohead protease